MANLQAKLSAQSKALEILERVENDHAFAHVLLQKLAESSDFDANQLAKIRHLVKGTLQHQGSIDAILSPLISNKRGLAGLEPFVRNLLRIAAFQILFLDNLPRQVIVNDSVELAKSKTHRGISGLVNAVLRKIDKSNLALLVAVEGEESIESLSQELSHPAWLIERWLRQWPLEEVRVLCQLNNSPWPMNLRVNRLKSNLEQLSQKLESYGLVVSQGKYAANCLVVDAAPKNFKLSKTVEYQQGEFHIQDQSSILVGNLVGAQAGERILDLCSAPGGKATLLAEAMRNQGEVIAVDPSEQRLGLVRSAAERLRISIVHTVAGQGQFFTCEKLFDRVLVDAPCTGTGMLGRKVDLRWQRQPEDLMTLTKLQMDLLRNAATLVRVGGHLIYSTCSIEPEENQQIASQFLSEHSDFEHSSFSTECSSELLNSEGCMQSLPHRHGIGGAFAARFRKVS